MVEVAPIVDSGRTGWAAAAASGTPMPQPILLPPAPVAASADRVVGCGPERSKRFDTNDCHRRKPAAWHQRHISVKDEGVNVGVKVQLQEAKL